MASVVEGMQGYSQKARLFKFENTDHWIGFNSATGSLVWNAVPDPSSALAVIPIGGGLIRRVRSHA